MNKVNFRNMELDQKSLVKPVLESRGGGLSVSDKHPKEEGNLVKIGIIG